MEEELRRLGVKIVTGKAPTVDEVKAVSPVGVVVACGAKPIIPEVPGTDLPNVVTSHDVISGKVTPQGKAAVIGAGMTGLECAESLCMNGCEVSIVEMLDHVGAGMFSVVVADMMERINSFHAGVFTSHKLKAITAEGALTENLATGEEILIPADTVVLSLGVRPDTETAELFRQEFEHVLVIGDNEKSGRIPHAMRDGYSKARAFLT